MGWLDRLFWSPDNSSKSNDSNSGVEQAIIWTDEGPIVQLIDGRIMLIKLQTPENPPIDYDMCQYSNDPVTYEYGSYKVTSDHHTVDLILTEDIPESSDCTVQADTDHSE